MGSVDSQNRPRMSLVGTSAMLFEAPGAFELEVQKRIWSLAQDVAGWPDVHEAVPGMTNLLLIFRAPPEDPNALVRALRGAWDRAGVMEIAGKLIEIPVVYGGQHGSDLAAAAAHTGLTPEELVQLHAAGEYTVFAVGSSPGFAYLHGLDPRICVPRKAVPALRVPAGAVTIGGSQTGVAVSTGPNGWHAIGWAPMTMFDPEASPPALLGPGDRIRFRVARFEP
jgi:5-oxoprolinase (ATP-hydrolysing) subunit B